MPDGVVEGVLDQRGRRGLRRAVALDHLVAEHAAKEGENLCGERRGAGDGDENVVEADGLLELGEDEAVVEPVRVVAAGEAFGLGGDAAIEEELGDAASVVDVLDDLLVHLVESGEGELCVKRG